ncbi:MAG: hypothetical protein Q9190_006150 [Brigantiaea leucoxantha]
MGTSDGTKKRGGHPFLSGNFSPVHTVLPLTPCTYTGTIPNELVGGEYVRNGGNPITNENLGRDAHWFDGDGMISGVLFRPLEKTGEIQPEFTNQFILTDVFLAAKTSPHLKTPMLPSITTLVNPASSLITIIRRIFRTIALVILSHLPGSPQAIKKISVANTAFYYHDGRALATCESGPPMRVELPGLGTVGWYNGKSAEGESFHGKESGPTFGGSGIFGWLREWVTAHPRIDPNTKELILYHNTFVPPYVNYSIVRSTRNVASDKDVKSPTHMLNRPVPGITSAKMMHDFGASKTHTIIMDLPLSLDPFNLAKNKPVVAYNPLTRSRFGIFPRYQPQRIRWYETNPCCIFHTANSWNTVTKDSASESFNMLCCRLTSASLVFSAGNLVAPQPGYDIPADLQEEEQCRLYYYQFDLSSDPSRNDIIHQWALAAIPFEFPTLRDSVSMSAAKYIYGCSVRGTTFGASLGRGVKINSLVKMDVETLITKGKRDPPTPIKGCVDKRDLDTIAASNDLNDPIKIFMMPEGWYAQEPRFVPRADGASEDDGWLLTYVFDESSQLTADGEPKMDAQSELWIIDAKNMASVVAKIRLPQRVPYGFHGNWISKQDIEGQRPIERLRSMPSAKSATDHASFGRRTWMASRRALEAYLE